MRNNKKALYEKIMRNISKEVKRILSEEISSSGYGRLADYANDKRYNIEREFKASGYTDMEKLKHLRFLASMKKKLADKANNRFIQEASGTLKNIVKKWKDGINVLDDKEVIPIFVMQDVPNKFSQHKYRLAIYISIFTSINPNDWDNSAAYQEYKLSDDDQYLLNRIISLLKNDLKQCGFYYWDTQIEKEIKEYKGMMKLIFGTVIKNPYSVQSDDKFNNLINDEFLSGNDVKMRYRNKEKGIGIRYKEIN